MPELPEVETIKRQLEKKVLHKRIEKIVVKDRRLLRGSSPQQFRSQVKGKYIREIFRRGKVLIFKLQEHLFLIIHLRMSGWLLLSKTIQEQARVAFQLSDSPFFNVCDGRVLGELRVTENWQDMPLLKAMGPEPLTLKKESFCALFKGKKAKIKPLLMDQRFLAGIGNIYAQESLFCAGIHPEKSAQLLKNPELERLYKCLCAVLTHAIAKSGSSIRSHRQVDGSQGGYVPFFKVYQRKGQTCFRCKALIERKVIGGRGTYFCPRCQN